MEEERKTAMSHDEMQDYWETLCSFSGEDIPNEVNQLMAKIHYPKFLYKYRAVNNNNLDALRSNKLFFSKASSYDDPFDTFLHIDVEKIRQEFVSNYSSPEALAALANGMKETFQNQPGIPQEFIQQVTHVEGLKQLFASGITNQFLSYLLTLRSKIQDEILSICFSENGFNETLWLKYADMHKGFCLMYDLNDSDSFHCGKLDRCANCGVYKYGTRLYPVYYRSHRSDADGASESGVCSGTSFGQFLIGCLVLLDEPCRDLHDVLVLGRLHLLHLAELDYKVAGHIVLQNDGGTLLIYQTGHLGKILIGLRDGHHRVGIDHHGITLLLNLLYSGIG